MTMTWYRSAFPIPSAVLYGLALELQEHRVLGADVEIVADPPWTRPTRAHPS